MENDRKQGIGPNSKAMGEIVRYLKNYPFLLITVAGLLILVGILIFDIEKLKEFKLLIYGVVLVPIGFQFMLEFRKQGGRRETLEKTAKIVKENETAVTAKAVHFSSKAIISLALSGLFLLIIGSEGQDILQDTNFQAGLLVVIGIPALLLGFLALNDTVHGTASGKGYAIAALALSVLMIVSSLNWMGQGSKQKTEPPAQVLPLPVVPDKTPSNQHLPMQQPKYPQPVQDSQQPAIATRCVTEAGWCPMMVTIPAGSICTCTNAYGVFPGLAQ